jgi:hypothetical protein
METKDERNLLGGRAMRHQFGWMIKVMGIFSAVPTLYLWLAFAIYMGWQKSLPGSPFFILLLILLSVPVSVVAAVRWTSWMYVVSVVAALTFVFVGFRLH